MTGNRGFLKICPIKSEIHPHDAKTPADTRPNGHASIGLRVLQRLSKRVFHIQPRGRNTIWARLSKVFYLEKQSFSRLVGWRSSAKLVQA
ncbi:MAG: hypothetical protein ABSH11_00740 [Verrucomicrobiota bacterium]